jgi:choline transport protein
MGKWGWLVNGVTVGWLVFAITFFSFPYTMPLTAQNMNYTCVVVGGLPILILMWWFVGSKQYKEKIVSAKEE